MSYSNLSDLEAAVVSTEAAMNLASDTDAGYSVYSKAVKAYYKAVDALSNAQSVEKAKEEANAARLAAAIAYDPNVAVLEAAADAASYCCDTYEDYQYYCETVRVFFDAVDAATATIEAKEEAEGAARLAAAIAFNPRIAALEEAADAASHGDDYAAYCKAVEVFFDAVDAATTAIAKEAADEAEAAERLAVAIAFNPAIAALESAADEASYRIETFADYTAYSEAVRVFFDAVDKALADKAALDSIVEKAIADSRVTSAAILADAIASSRAASAAILAKYSI